MIAHGGDVNDNEYNYTTPIIGACERKDGNIEMIELLLSHGAQVNCDDCKCYQSLQVAIEGHRYDVMDYLLANGADIDGYADYDEYGEASFLAVACGFSKEYNSYEQTDKEMVKFLLQHGADMYLPSLWGELPFAVAYNADRPDMSILHMFFDHGFDINAMNEEHMGSNSIIVLADACVKADLDAIRLFILHGADVNCIRQDREVNHSGDSDDLHVSTALISACVHGSEDALQLLLAYGADVNLLDERGNTPLMYLCKNYDITQDMLPCLSILLERGLDLSTVNMAGMTVFDFLEEGCELAMMLKDHLENADRKPLLK